MKKIRWTDVFILPSNNSWINFFERTSASKRYIVWQDGYFLWVAVKFNLYVWERLVLNLRVYTVKKVSDFFPSPARMSLTKLSLACYCCDFKCELFACLSIITYCTFFVQSFHKPEIQQLCPFKTLSELCWVRVQTGENVRMICFNKELKN